MVLRNAHVFQVAWVRLRDQRTCLGGEQAALSVSWSHSWCPGQPFLTLSILFVCASPLLQPHDMCHMKNMESS